MRLQERRGQEGAQVSRSADTDTEIQIRAPPPRTRIEQRGQRAVAELGQRLEDPLPAVRIALRSLSCRDTEVQIQTSPRYAAHISVCAPGWGRERDLPYKRRPIKRPLR